MIETDRLRLRSYEHDDLEHLVGLIGNWKVARWLGNTPSPYTERDGQAWIELVRSDHQAGRPTRFAVALRATDELIGGIGFVRGAELGESAEIGYWLGQPF